MPISERLYAQLALADKEGQWELVHGRPRAKPWPTVGHNIPLYALPYVFMDQIDRNEFTFRVNTPRLRCSPAIYLVPDFCIYPMDYVRRGLREFPDHLEVYDEPVSLVVESWEPPGPDYDVNDKLAVYRGRGDTEIWLIQPYEHTITTWTRQQDGSYNRTFYLGGTIILAGIPGVTIEVDNLFQV